MTTVSQRPTTSPTRRRRAAPVDRRRVVWVITRSSQGRPLLMHRVVDETSIVSICGRATLSDRSRYYAARPITAIACVRCTRLTEAGY